MSSLSEFLILHATPQATETFEQCATSGKTGCLMMADPLTLATYLAVPSVILVIGVILRFRGTND